MRTDPKNDDAHYNRACLYVEKGDFDKAVADLNESIRLNPWGDWKHNGLAWLLATCPNDGVRNGKKAVEVATTACKQTQRK